MFGIPYGFISGLERTPGADMRFVAHLYEGPYHDPGLPMCSRGWNRDAGTSYSIWRNNLGKGVCKTCTRRAEAGKKGVWPRGLAPGPVRPATSEDLDDVAALEVAIFQNGAWSPSQLERALPYIRVVDNGWGYVLAQPVGPEIHVLRLGVPRLGRRRGLATKLMESVLEEGKLVRLETASDNLPALALYETLGFVRLDMSADSSRRLTELVRRPAPR